MFGAFLRGALTIGVAVLMAAFIQAVVPFLLEYQGPEDSMLYSTFAGVAENALLIMLAAIAAGVLARSIVESRGV